MLKNAILVGAFLVAAGGTFLVVFGGMRMWRDRRLSEFAKHQQRMRRSR